MAPSLKQWLQRPLDDAARQRAFLFAAVVLVVALVGVVQLRERGTSNRAPATWSNGSTPRGTVVDVPVAAVPTPAATPTEDAPEHRVADRAREFLAAFLRYEAGKLDDAVRTQLRRTARPSFARFLIANPARPPAGRRVPVGRVASLELVRDGDGEIAGATATIDRRGHLTLVGLILERHGGRWLVAEVR